MLQPMKVIYLVRENARTMEEGRKKKKSTAVQWTIEAMGSALSAVRNKEMGLREASRSYGIPTTTLKRHLDGGNKYAVESSIYCGRPQMLPPELEDQLVEHILQSERMFFGFTRQDVQSLAFDIAEKNGLPHVFNVHKQRAGKDWMKLFLKRHPELSMRQPEATSLARATGFNKESVGKFFDILESLIDEHSFGATFIYNMDETSISTVQKKCQKVVARKGKHQIGSISSGERGSNTTVVCCVNAAGHYVPPLILFKRKRLPPEIRDGAPPGSIVTGNESGWMDKAMFLNWLHHFIASTKPSLNSKLLLILDGHSSHTKSLEAVDLARRNGIIMLSLPPHTTHRLQPLDVTFFKPLQTFYGQAQESWLRSNAGRSITALQICQLFNKAYSKAANLANAASGFARCGIWPCDRHVFSEEHFIYDSMICFQAAPDPVRSLPSESTHGLPAQEPRLPFDEEQLPSKTSVAELNVPSHIASEQGVLTPQVEDMRVSTPPTDDIRVIGLSHYVYQVSNPLTYDSSPINNPRDTTSPLNEPMSNRLVNESRFTSPLLLPRLQQSTTKSVSTNPDGRCFFRSVVICMDTNLQKAERDGNGLLFDPLLMIQEQCKSDELRAQTVQFMCQHVSDFPDTESALNSDMPANAPKFSSIQERIISVAYPTTPVGDFEISATCEVLKRSIHIVDARDGHILKYKAEKFAVEPPLTIKYTSHGDNCGHYEALVPRFIPVQQLYPLSCSLRPQKRPRKTECQVLTSSPYKQMLTESHAKKSKQNKTQRCKKNPALKGTLPTVSEEEWYCFFCQQSYEDDMIQCLVCKRWAHEDCAGTRGESAFTCQQCQG